MKKTKAETKPKSAKAIEKYRNGQIKFTGKYFECPVQERGTWMIKKLKVGRWVYYYPNGNIRRIENYNKPKSCYDGVYKYGKWEYRNASGEPYLTEEYVNDTLIISDIEYYEGKRLFSKLQITTNQSDTTIYGSDSDRENLVINPGLEIFKYRPVYIQNDGYSKAEDAVWGWWSPDIGTPDYYNRFRSIKDVPNHLPNDISSSINGYFGMILYHRPSKNFSEHIQTKLKQRLLKKKFYCLKVDILMLQNSGYSIGNFDVMISEFPIRFQDEDIHSPVEPTFSFNIEESKALKWTTLCTWFQALGNEEYLTLGNTLNNDKVHITPNQPGRKSALDINESAYYLIDNIELIQVVDRIDCNCSATISDLKNSSPSPKVNGGKLFPLGSLSISDKITFENIQFEFDKSDLLDSAYQELEQLRDMLNANPSIKILVIGHTDSIGSNRYNLRLSEKRAQAVKQWLVDNSIDAGRLKVKGLGSSQPLSKNNLETCRRINRRVEIQILEM